MVFYFSDRIILSSKSFHDGHVDQNEVELTPAGNAAMTRVAAIQMASGPMVASNLAEAERLIKAAVQAGAQLLVLPENFAIMPTKDADRLAAAEH